MVLAIADYLPRPTMRSVSRCKFVGVLCVTLSFSTLFFTTDSKGLEHTVGQTLETAAAEVHTDLSNDNQLLARVIHDWKGAIEQRQIFTAMFTNVLMSNANKSSLGPSSLEMLKSIATQTSEQCELFLKLQSDIHQINNKITQMNADAAVALSVNRCKVVNTWMSASLLALSTDVMQKSGLNVGDTAAAVAKAYKGPISNTKEQEPQAIKFISAALRNQGMNTDLTTY